MRIELKKTDKGWIGLVYDEDDMLVRQTKICKDRRAAIKEAKK